MADFEAVLGRTHDINADSCSFDVVTAENESNKVRFRFRTKDDQVLEGSVVINAVASEGSLSAFVIFEVDEPEAPT